MMNQGVVDEMDIRGQKFQNYFAILNLIGIVAQTERTVP